MYYDIYGVNRNLWIYVLFFTLYTKNDTLDRPLTTQEAKYSYLYITQ